MNICLHVAYVGAPFFGWQKTKMGPSIEESLQQVLETILQEKVSLQAAARTDRGVHADHQVVNFRTEKQPDLEKLKMSCNCLLPKTIRIFHAEKKTEAFHPTLDAHAKTYRYEICAGALQLPKKREISWHVVEKCDLALMRDVAQKFVGKKDFSAFTNGEHESYTREIFSFDVAQTRSGYLMEIVGRSFLYKMVRNLVGTLVLVGQKKIDPAILFSMQRKDFVGHCAPAHGLTLCWVEYDRKK